MQPFLLLVIAGCGAPFPEGEVVLDTVVWEQTGDRYALDVYLPEDLPPGAPWILTHDGDLGFYGMAALLEREIEAGRATPCALVGVGNGALRDRDYTPLPEAWDPPEDGWEGVGLVDDYTAWLADVIVPRVEAEHDLGGAPERRVLTGHSYGGLATLRAMHTSRDTWGGFGATSPALWWDQGVPFAWEAEHAAVSDALPVDLYLSMGSVEQTSMNALFDEYVRVIEARHYRGLELTSHVWYGLEHYSSFDPAFAEMARELVP